MDFKPLKAALENGVFDIAELFRKRGAQVKGATVGVVTDFLRHGSMYHRALRGLKNDLIPIPITSSYHPFNSFSLTKKIAIYLKQLPKGTNRAQAILNSDFHEVKRIKAIAEQAFKYCDAFWISGGENLWQGWYDPTHYELDALDLYRDILEFAILDLQQKHIYKPLIGVCRGNQAVNVFYSGTLQNIGGQFHVVNFLKFIRPEGILGSTLPSGALWGWGAGYSAHHQAIDKLGDMLDIVAISNEGIVKAIQSKSNQLPLMGTQFHPEAFPSGTNNKVLRRFIKAAQASKADTCLAIDLNLDEVLDSLRDFWALIVASLEASPIKYKYIFSFLRFACIVLIDFRRNEGMYLRALNALKNDLMFFLIKEIAIENEELDKSKSQLSTVENAAAKNPNPIVFSQFPGVTSQDVELHSGTVNGRSNERNYPGLIGF